MNKAIDYLETHRSSTPSRWREDAEWRKDNEYWLKYSRYITLQVLRAMETQSITQAKLAKRMGCSQQYISNLLKGSSNMTLETIARLENALNIDLVKSALSYTQGYTTFSTSRHQYLNDSAGEEIRPGIKTRHLVDGNKSLKK
ncbi:MAG: helix-turn-helix transcriptional regulator [Bacteroidales bacterium]|nr:helix-turn-helix transcriptional regulator [Bacteroidales bacterium]